MRGSTIQLMLNKLGGDWQAVNEHHLRKEYAFKDFIEALHFVNLVAEVSERESHHPSVELSWGKAVITIYSHVIDGLSESDFILAAKCDDLYDQS